KLLLDFSTLTMLPPDHGFLHGSHRPEYDAAVPCLIRPKAEPPARIYSNMDNSDRKRHKPLVVHPACHPESRSIFPGFSRHHPIPLFSYAFQSAHWTGFSLAHQTVRP